MFLVSIIVPVYNFYNRKGTVIDPDRPDTFYEKV